VGADTVARDGHSQGRHGRRHLKRRVLMPPDSHKDGYRLALRRRQPGNHPWAALTDWSRLPPMRPTAAKSQGFRRYVLRMLVGRRSWVLLVFDPLHCTGTNLFEAAVHSGGV